MRTLVVAVLACVCLAACGVQSQHRAQRVPAAELPAELGGSPAPTARDQAASVVVYLVEGARLVRQQERADRRDVEQAVRALLGWQGRGGPRRSALPAGTAVRRLELRAAVLSVDLSRHFGQVRGRDQVLAVAQLVWTVTEFPAVREVKVLVEGEAIDLPLQDGAVSSGSAGRRDYLSVGPAD